MAKTKTCTAYDNECPDQCRTCYYYIDGVYDHTGEECRPNPACNGNGNGDGDGNGGDYCSILGDNYVETYLGCTICYTTRIVGGAYYSDCVEVYHHDKSDVKKDICLQQDGVWDGSTCSFEEPPECYADQDCPTGYVCEGGRCVYAPTPSKQTLALYCIDIATGGNLYAWGEAALDGVTKSATGYEIFFTGTVVGSHTVELKSLPPDYTFDHWETIIYPGWAEVLIDNPNSPTTGITTQSGAPGALLAYVTKPVGIPTTTTLSAPDKTGVNEKFYISGILYETESGIPIPSQPINHSYYDAIHEPKSLGSSTTRVDGDYLKEVSIPESGTWTLKSDFPGTPGYAASRSVADTMVAASPLEAAVSIAGSVAVGLVLIMYGLR